LIAIIVKAYNVFVKTVGY